jgi:hypothetical protein
MLGEACISRDMEGNLKYHNFALKVKVKVTLVQALRLCTGRMAHRGSRGIALLFYEQWH